MVGVSFLGVEKLDHFGIDDILAAVLCNVLVSGYLEGVGAFDTLTCVGGVGTKYLEEATNLIGI